MADSAFLVHHPCCNTQFSCSGRKSELRCGCCSPCDRLARV